MNRNDILPLLNAIKGIVRYNSIEHYNQMKEYKQIRDKIRHMDEVELFYGLFCLAVQNEHRTPAGYAVSLLFELNPTCQISCREAIKAMLLEWNVSTRELPFYLFKQFGESRVRDAMTQIRFGSLTKNEESLLNAVEYWMNIAANEDR